MKLGITIFPTEYSITPAALAVAAEDRGLDSLWLPEHSHIPLSRKSPWPGGPELPRHYYDCMDPFVSLASAAAVTRSLKLATGICLVVQRDPLQLAKEVATLDALSGGRVIFGVGAGWNAEEMADHGTDFHKRFDVMRERISALKAIWTADAAEYHGTFVDFGPMATRPKPVQKPHPPIIVGGGFPHGARRAIEYGDAWMPIAGRGGGILDTLPEFRAMAAAAGRDGLAVSLFGAGQGDLEAGQVARYREAGLERLVFLLPSEEADAILPLLDRIARLMPAARG